VSYATDVAADGLAIAGTYTNDSNRERAFVWTQAGGITPIGPDDFTGSYAHAISADGSTVVGRRGAAAFHWDAANGMLLLQGLSGGIDARALDVSLDGSVTVGWVRASNETIQAARWTATGLEALVHEPLKETGWRTFAQGVDATGDVVAGDYYFESAGIIGNQGAFVWTPETGMQPLSGILEALGVDFSGWTLTAISDVSLDGRTFVGSGENPSGQREAFLVRLDSIPDVANVPEPGTALLLGLGAAMLGARRRRAMLPACRT
jgi:hypothetical protein